MLHTLSTVYVLVSTMSMGERERERAALSFFFSFWVTTIMQPAQPAATVDRLRLRLKSVATGSVKVKSSCYSLLLLRDRLRYVTKTVWYFAHFNASNSPNLNDALGKMFMLLCICYC